LVTGIAYAVERNEVIAVVRKNRAAIFSKLVTVRRDDPLRFAFLQNRLRTA
jgi:hypothetical protein